MAVIVSATDAGVDVDDYWISGIGCAAVSPRVVMMASCGARKTEAPQPCRRALACGVHLLGSSRCDGLIDLTDCKQLADD